MAFRMGKLSLRLGVYCFLKLCAYPSKILHRSLTLEVNSLEP